MKKILFIICIACAVLFFYNLQSRDFWAPDEGDFAQIVKELDNNIVVPHLNGHPYGEKPPLFYYINYLSTKIFSFLKDEVSMRIPTALCALLAAVLFFYVAHTSFGKETSFLAALILISSPLYYWQARYLQVDMVFAAFVSSSLLCFFWFFHGRKRSLYLLFYILAGFAFMTKGPLAVILIFPVVFLYSWLQRDLRIFRDKGTIIGICIFLLIIVPWYLSVYMKEGFPYLQENIIRQNLTRFFDAWSHKRPIYYYLTTLPMDFFPWSLFLPMGIYLSITSWRSDNRIKFFLIWFLWMFLFFSLSSGKISKYMLPLLPATALMTAQTFIKERSRYVFYVSMFLAVLFSVLGIMTIAYKTGLYREFYPERVLVGILSILLALSIGFALWMKRTKATVYLLCGFLMIVYMAANISIYNKLNPYKSPKPFSGKVRYLVQNDKPWVYYGSMRGVYIYYIGSLAVHIDEHRVEELKQLQQKLDEFYLVTRKRDLGEVQKALTQVSIILDEKIGDTPMVLVRYQKHGG